MLKSFWKTLYIYYLSCQIYINFLSKSIVIFEFRIQIIRLLGKKMFFCLPCYVCWALPGEQDKTLHRIQLDEHRCTCISELPQRKIKSYKLTKCEIFRTRRFILRGHKLLIICCNLKIFLPCYLKSQITSDLF